MLLVDQVAVSSLEMLDKQLDPFVIAKSNLLPMLEVELDLRNNSVAYVPNIGYASRYDTKKKSVRELIQSLVDGFIGVGCVFKRLDTGEGNYLREIQVSQSVRSHRPTPLLVSWAASGN